MPERPSLHNVRARDAASKEETSTQNLKNDACEEKNEIFEREKPKMWLL